MHKIDATVNPLRPVFVLTPSGAILLHRFREPAELQARWLQRAHWRKIGHSLFD